MSHALLEAASAADAALVGNSRQYLTFALADELYAISIRRVREILEFRNLTEVPLMPGFLRGVTNLRGLVIPVIDLLERFGIGRTEIGPRTCIVVVEIDGGEERIHLGILVNAVHEVLPVEPEHIGARPTFGPRIRVDFIEALLDVGKGFMIALDLTHVLALERERRRPVLARLRAVPNLETTLTRTRSTQCSGFTISSWLRSSSRPSSSAPA